MIIPITLVTGFLGSGKSTLINKVIANKRNVPFGLIINEFGDVKLESQIIEAQDDPVVELSNGCMCCVARGDLVDTVAGLIKSKPEIRHIVMEASGLSDPVPIANTFLNETLGGKVRFDTVICVVDAVNFPKAMEKYPVAETQLQYADFVLLSKVDTATDQQIAVTKEKILSIQPQSRIVEMGKDFTTDLIFDTSTLDHGELAQLEIEAHHHDDHEHHHHGGHDTHHKTGIVTQPDGKKVYRHVHEPVETFFYKSETPLDLLKLGKLIHELPENIVRAKGFLYFSGPDACEKKFILQVVAGRPNLDSRPWDDNEVHQSAMVFIGRGFDQDRLATDLDACKTA